MWTKLKAAMVGAALTLSGTAVAQGAPAPAAEKPTATGAKAQPAASSVTRPSWTIPTTATMNGVPGTGRTATGIGRPGSDCRCGGPAGYPGG